jgi:hypothetical protein
MRDPKMPTEHHITGRPLRQDNLSAACRRGTHGSCSSLNCQCSCNHPVSDGHGAGGKLPEKPKWGPAGGFGSGGYGK